MFKKRAGEWKGVFACLSPFRRSGAYIRERENTMVGQVGVVSAHNISAWNTASFSKGAESNFFGVVESSEFEPKKTKGDLSPFYRRRVAGAKDDLVAPRISGADEGNYKNVTDEVPDILTAVRYPDLGRIYDGGYKFDGLQKKFAIASHISAAIEGVLAEAANKSVNYEFDVTKTSSKTADPDNIPEVFYKTTAGQAYILWRRLAGVNCGGLFLNFHRKRMSRGLTKQQREVFEKLMEHLRTSISPTQLARLRTREKMFRSSVPGTDRLRSWELGRRANQEKWGSLDRDAAPAPLSAQENHSADCKLTERRCHIAGREAREERGK